MSVLGVGCGSLSLMNYGARRFRDAIFIKFKNVKCSISRLPPAAARVGHPSMTGIVVSSPLLLKMTISPFFRMGEDHCN